MNTENITKPQRDTTSSSLASLYDLSSLGTEPIGRPELQKATAQFEKRQRRIRDNRLGIHRSWLFVIIDPLSDDRLSDRSGWLKDELSKIVDRVPNSAYKQMLGHLLHSLQSEDANLFSQQGTLRFAVSEGLQVFVMPSIGILSFCSPSKSLKTSLDKAGFECEWNRPMGGDLYEDIRPTRTEKMPSEDEKLYAANISKLQARLGRGNGAAIAVIDSGLSHSSKQCSGRVQCHLTIERAGDGGYKWVNGFSTKPFLHGHGTQVCSIAAGSTMGVAPEANIVSIALPVTRNGRFDQLALFFALEMLVSPYGPCIGTTPLRDYVSTILVANGFLLQNRVQPNFSNIIAHVFENLNDFHDVVTVAAIGNQSGKVAFPASFQLVYAVGALNKNGTRYLNSGFGFDSTGNLLPDGHVLGEAVLCEDAAGATCTASGTSFAAAILAGVFTLLSVRKPDAASRWTALRAATKLSTDEKGELRAVDLGALK